MAAPTAPTTTAATDARPAGRYAAVEMQRLRHRFRLWRRYWLTPHRAFTPLVVLATYRSGSNLLVDYLRSVPGVQCCSEVLNPRLALGLRRGDQSPKQALSHLRYSLQALGGPVRGCKLMLDQLAACRLNAADISRAFPAARFIVLYRESLPDQLLSVRSARETGQWVVHQGRAPQQVQVKIDPLELRWFCDETRALYGSLLAEPALAERALLLSYEELIADPAGVFARRICPLLGLPSATLNTTLVKQNPRPLMERILNYSDIAALLDSPWCRQSYGGWQTGSLRAAV